MRVTQNTYTRLYAQQTQSSRETIGNLQQQISSGQRIHKPSDDPLSAGKTVQLEGTLGQLKQYERNGNYVESRLNMEESALREMSDKLISLREVSILANNDTLSTQDHGIYLEDVKHRREEVFGHVNSQGPNGEYLFSGTERTTKPLTDDINYLGNEGSQLIKIGLNSNLSVGTPASKVIAYETSTETTDVFATIDSLQNLLQSASDGNKPDDFHAQMATIIERLDDAQTHMTTLQADVGHRLNRLDGTRQDNTDVELMLNTDLESLQGLDFADAISRLQTEIQSLEAIQSTYSRINNLSLFKYVS